MFIMLIIHKFRSFFFFNIGIFMLKVLPSNKDISIILQRKFESLLPPPQS